MMTKMKLAQVARELRSGTSSYAQEALEVAESAVELYRQNDAACARIARLEEELRWFLDRAHCNISPIEIRARINRVLEVVEESGRFAPAASLSRAQAVVETAQRVYRKYGAKSDWTEWTDLRDALAAYDAGEPK